MMCVLKDPHDGEGPDTHTLDYRMKQFRSLTFLMMVAAGVAVTGCAEEMDDPALYTQTIRAVLNDGVLETRTCVAEGDSGMEVYTNLYNVYMDRLQGMNTFVNNQTWPSWTIVED